MAGTPTPWSVIQSDNVPSYCVAVKSPKPLRLLSSVTMTPNLKPEKLFQGPGQKVKSQMCATPASGRERLEDQEHKAGFGFLVTLRL